MPTRAGSERERETVGVAMADPEAVDRDFAGVEDLAFRQRNERERNRCPSLAPETCQHPDDDVERALAAVDGHQVGTLPQPQRGKETGDAEHVVEMAVRQQQATESRAAPKQLALRTLAAIDHDAVPAGLNKEARMVSVR